MCDTKGKKRAFITISSDDEEDDDDDDCYIDINTPTSCDNDEEDEESGSDFEEDVSDDDYHCNGDDDQVDKEEPVCNKITRLLQEGSQLQDLSLTECKTYLRELKLRLSGTKAECVNRIKEYWRIKDGNGEALYPRSSFNINCTGDVCKGDNVLFTQKVYQKFDKMKRSGNILGKRTIAGRITKESYGAAKQQHTFTVEVLWSKGIKKLAPLFPLLVKGRNLYKMRTYRQRWKNESERLVVLAEKHKRGAAAREVRARKKMKRSSTTACKKELGVGGGDNRQRPFNHQLSQTSRSIEADKASGVRQHQYHQPSQTSRSTEADKARGVRQHQYHQPSQTSRSTEADKARGVRQHQYTRVKNVRENDHCKNSLTVRRGKSDQLRNPESDRRCHDFTHHHHNEVRDPTYESYTTNSQDYYRTRREFERQRAHLSYPFERTHMTRLPHSKAYVDDHAFTPAEHERNNNVAHLDRACTNPIFEYNARSFSRLPVSVDTFRPFHSIPYRTDAYGPWSRGI